MPDPRGMRKIFYQPEAVALLTGELLEGARNRKTVAELMNDAGMFTGNSTPAIHAHGKASYNVAMGNAVEPIGRMTPYGVEHIAVLIVTILTAVGLVWWIRRLRRAGTEDGFLRAAGWLMLTTTIAWMVWGMLPGNWNIDQSLPFHYSDALRMITAIALLTRANWAIAICYYWGLTLNLQSVITPDLNYFDYPVLEFFAYWFLHMVALLVPIIFVWGLGYRPGWRGYGLTYAATVAWAGIALLVNVLTGANYGYLSRGPEGPSILDLLGPWPSYVLWEAVIIAVVWALMTWPWQTRRARNEKMVVQHQTSAGSLTKR